MKLPNPERSRWQPLRGGLMNLYFFDHLRLRYEDGRLLLRGNNGTGKSRILALQLPFLLDGEISPNRVEPDGDPSKRIEWHLLMDGRYDDRIGYTWLEFGRIDDDGTPRFTTIGCGMKAIKGKGAPTRWYFVTDQRIDAELHLHNKSNVPLRRPALEDALQERGKVFEKAKEYRVAVDQALFGLGEHRYQALIDLLIQLRRPQLSRKLDEKLLSDALSQALPPLSSTILEDIAEAFRSLETDRRALEDDRNALGSTKTFTSSYRRYVRVATKRRADVLRERHSKYEGTMRLLRQAQREQVEVVREQEKIDTALTRNEQDQRKARAALAELEADPVNRDAKRLDDALSMAKNSSGEAQRAAEQEVRAEGELARASEEAAKARAKAQEAQQALERHREECSSRAAKVGLHDLLTKLDENAVDERVSDRKRQAEHLQGLLVARDGKRTNHQEAVKSTDLVRSALDRATELRNGRQADRDRAYEDLLSQLSVWVDNLEILTISESGKDTLFERLADWSEQGDGPDPIVAVVTNTHGTAVRELAAKRQTIVAKREDTTKRYEEFQQEREGLLLGTHQPPPRPPWRDPESRAERDGAPLWALCDFRSDVDARTRAGIEAALEASGILDAWVTADGRIVNDESADLFVICDRSTPHPLTKLLVPVIDEADPRASRVSEDVVTKILASIGCEAMDEGTWVASDGSFMLGPLHGRARKDDAEHIGHAAREQARRRRLEVLAKELADIEAQLVELTKAIERHDERLAQADREREDAPSGTELRDAVRSLAQAERHTLERMGELREARVLQAEAKQILDASETKLQDDAAQLELVEWVEAPQELFAALGQLDLALVKLWAELRLVETHRETLTEREQSERRAKEALKADARSAREARARADEAKARYEILRDTVGVKVDELQRKLHALREEVSVVDLRLGRLRKDKSEADKKAGAVLQAVEDRTEQLREHDELRQEASAQLQALARTGVWASLGDDWRERDLRDDWSATAAIGVARELDKHLGKIPSDDRAWEQANSRLQRDVQDLTNSLLSHNLSPSATHRAEVLVVTIPYQGRTLDPDALAQTLGDEIASRERILDEQEREILENHLITEVARHLHERIRDGERLVREMDQEIQSRPLSTGMSFRFKWEPISDPGLTEARRRLLAAQGVWSPEDRNAIGAFLQQRIQDERNSSDTGTWREHLEKALDYRAWHEFRIERKQNDTWKRLTRRTYGTGSGGEKAIALTLPQLAAAAAHYKSASATAPRLILMDEAFVGVDSDMRAKCMGLLAAFELDFVMTSEREWGCYETLPALAIYQLVTRPKVDAVYETRWVWNGRSRVRDLCEVDDEATVDAETPA